MTTTAANDTYKIAVEVPGDVIRNLLGEAIRASGETSWCSLSADRQLASDVRIADFYAGGMYHIPGAAPFTTIPLADGCGLIFHVIDDNDDAPRPEMREVLLDREKLLDGVARFSRRAPEAFAIAMNGGEISDDDADLFLQLCLFGIVMYL